MSNTNSKTSVETDIVELEKQWAAAIQLQDATQMDHFLAEGYFLVIAVQDQPLQVVPRAAWLEALKVYVTESFQVDAIRVQVYGDTAVVFMLFTQKAIVGGRDRSAQFVITDIWVKQENGWRVAERHSSRPEQPAEARSQ